MPDWHRQYAHLDALWEGLLERHPITESKAGQRHVRRGELHVTAAGHADDGEEAAATSAGSQSFTLGIRSHVAGDEILIECESTIGFVDLQDDAVLEALADALDGRVKLCIEPRVGNHQDRVYVRRELLFDPDSTRLPDVLTMVENTLPPAFRLRVQLENAGLLGTSAD